MSIENGFYFIPKKWLGDSNILAMDWDCRGMHLHLMAIAWQQTKKGFLLADDTLLRKYLNNPSDEDWKRIKNQIFSAWKKITIIENNQNIDYLYQPGLIENEELKILPKKTTKRRTKKEDLKIISSDFSGFNLENILKAKATTTILYEKSNKEEKSTIWTIGIQLLQQNGESETKARSFLAKLVKDFGEKPVAQSIANLSIQNKTPIEIHSYLIGILKKQQKELESKKTTSRGMVSL
jgi:hypothetical protein